MRSFGRTCSSFAASVRHSEPSAVAIRSRASAFGAATGGTAHCGAARRERWWWLEEKKSLRLPDQATATRHYLPRQKAPGPGAGTSAADRPRRTEAPRRRCFAGIVSFPRLRSIGRPASDGVPQGALAPCGASRKRCRADTAGAQDHGVRESPAVGQATPASWRCPRHFRCSRSAASADPGGRPHAQAPGRVVA